MSDGTSGSVGARAVAALNSGDLEAATAYMREMVRLHDRMGMTILAVTENSAVQTMELSEETAGAAPDSAPRNSVPERAKKRRVILKRVLMGGFPQ